MEGGRSTVINYMCYKFLFCKVSIQPWDAEPGAFTGLPPAAHSHRSQ